MAPTAAASAARSPVTISSSPTQRYRSITPESLRRRASDSAKTLSSSQELLSPSAFTRPRAPATAVLKSGSRVQKVPEGIRVGLESAGSLWRTTKDVIGEGYGQEIAGQDGKAVEGNVEKVKAAGKSAGKLVKPKKVVKSPEVPESPRFDSFMQFDEEGEGHSTKNTDTPRPRRVTLLAEKTAPVVARRPSISLSEYSFDGDMAPLPAILPAAKPAEKAVPAKKPRKRAAKPTDGDGPTVAKKARKTKAKSEAIILDSDEPEVLAEDMDVERIRQEPMAVKAAQPKIKKPRAKKAKAKPSEENRHLDAAPPKPKTSRAREPKQKATSETAEKSSYFAHANTPNAVPLTDTATLPGAKTTANFALPTIESAIDLAVEAAPQPVEVAPKRRRSWTPAKDSLPYNQNNVFSQINADLDENMGQMPLSALIGNFSYTTAEAPLLKRTNSGEAVTKRRRIEFSDAASVPPPPRVQKGKDKAAEKRPNKPKSPKKKPQTITALATAAYQPAQALDTAQSTVSTFFAPRKVDLPEPPPAVDTETTSIATKPKKPRKSRTKAVNADDTTASTKKATKAKGKVKPKAVDLYPPLLSPTQAAQQMHNQDFLFGTSSQLAAEESPTFIRDMQLAVRESEAHVSEGTQRPFSSQAPLSSQKYAGSQVRKSCHRVPTAPHGTCLSLVQAERELWCTSARDRKGGILAREERIVEAESPRVMQAIELQQVSAPHMIEHLPTVEREQAPTLAPLHVQDAELPTLDRSVELEFNTASAPKQPVVSTYVDVSHTSPAAAAKVVPFLPGVDSAVLPSPCRRTLHGVDECMLLRNTPDELGVEPSATVPTRPGFHSTTISSPCRETLDVQDEWMLLQSEPENLIMEPSAAAPPQPLPGNNEENWMLLRSEDSILFPAPGDNAKPLSSPRHLALRSPTLRPALASLDGNAPIISPTRSFKPARVPFHTSAPSRASTTSPSKARTHPKEKDVQQARPRGRPRKAAAGGAALILSPPAPKRARGRPRKEWAHIDDLASSSPTLPPPGGVADDILSDLSPPSPRRYRIASVRPLEMSAPVRDAATVVPLTKAPLASASRATLKATDSAFLAGKSVLFNDITAAITSAPPSNDLGRPTWHEKILLYDPIVLEDLAAYLNTQGVHMTIEKEIAKKAGKGRKKKAAEVDTELVREEVEVKPWMVQKWCEEKGICCLWREGLRGGVRGRY